MLCSIDIPSQKLFVVRILARTKSERESAKRTNLTAIDRSDIRGHANYSKARSGSGVSVLYFWDSPLNFTATSSLSDRSDRIEHNLQGIRRRVSLEKLQVTVCIRPTAELPQNHLFQIWQQANHSPRFETFFLSHNRYTSYLNGSQSQFYAFPGPKTGF
jgi:hypothetical protein